MDGDGVGALDGVQLGVSDGIDEGWDDGLSDGYVRCVGEMSWKCIFLYRRVDKNDKTYHQGW
jgi:hypothetical protein